MLPIPYPYHRAIGVAVYSGMALIGIGLAIAGALGLQSNPMTVAALVSVGGVMLIGGTIVWVLVDKPVVDPYEQPPPDYSHAEGRH